MTTVKLIELLLSKGYEPYKFVVKSNWNREAKRQAQCILEEHSDGLLFKTGDINSDESSFYVPVEFNTTYLRSNYNTSAPGGLTTHFLLNKDINSEIIFGLGEVGEPPQLLYPQLHSLTI